MVHRHRLLACLSVGSLVIFAVVPGQAGAASTPTPRTLTGTVPAAVSGAALLGHRDPSDIITISVGLRLRARDQLMATLRSLNDPSSPNYHRYLSLQQMNDQFNPTVGQQQKVERWLQGGGLRVTGTYANHLMVSATGTAGQIESLLGISINQYRGTVNGRRATFFAPDRNPVAPASVAGIVATVTGLDTVPRFHAGASNGSTHGAAPYYPQDLANAYDVNPLWNVGANGTGQHIGITLWTVPPSDTTLLKFHSTTGANVATQGNGRLRVIRVDGGTTSTDAGEAGIDIEMASGMAPGATIDYYEAPTDSSGNPTAQGLLDALNLAGTATVNNREISNSWGGCEASSASDAFTQAAESIFASNGATGHNYFFASGDNGSWCDPLGNGVGIDPYADYPASSPNVVSVGGTAFTNTISGGYPGETSWVYNSTANNGSPEGSGGGYSAIFSRPSWETGSGLTANGERGYPDVAAVGDPNTGVLACYGASGQCGWFGGTSVATPLWAGFVTDINAYLLAQKQPALGFLPPTLYSLASQPQTYPEFHDITGGNNGAYSAGIGWDAVTGLGSPDVWNLARDIVGGPVAPPTDTPTPTSTSTSTGTPAPTDTPTSTPTSTGTPPPTDTPTSTPTSTGTPPPTDTPTSIPTSTPTATPTVINPAGGLLSDAGFESGLLPWQTYSRSNHALLSMAAAHTGQYGALFCGSNSCDDRLWQTSATLPSSITSATVTFWLKRTSTETTYCGDILQVMVRRATGAALTPAWRFCNATTGWVQYTLNVGSYLKYALGKPVQVYFRATTNTIRPTTWLVDDVAFTVAGSSSSNAPTATPSPTPSPAPVVGSNDCTGTGCTQALLSMLNADRALYGVAPLTPNFAMSNGSGYCVGAYGHSLHMARMGAISHDQFPSDVCSAWYTAGENVGESNSGNELNDLQMLDQSMMAENSPPKAPGCWGSHACNIINPAFHQIGIGIYVDASGTTWLTEDFAN